jgi:hypothetical protein
MTLEQLEARLAALDRALAGNVSPKLREARRRATEAARHGRECGRCGERFDDGAVVYLAGLGLGSKGQRWQAPVCEGCAPGYMKRPGRVASGSCETCARPLVWGFTAVDLYRIRRFCSARCEWTHHNSVRNARAALERVKACEGCGETFTASRRDAKTCSPACKQKASRRRMRRQA